MTAPTCAVPVLSASWRPVLGPPFGRFHGDHTQARPLPSWSLGSREMVIYPQATVKRPCDKTDMCVPCSQSSASGLACWPRFSEVRGPKKPSWLRLEVGEKAGRRTPGQGTGLLGLRAAGGTGAVTVGRPRRGSPERPRGAPAAWGILPSWWGAGHTVGGSPLPVLLGCREGSSVGPCSPEGGNSGDLHRLWLRLSTCGSSPYRDGSVHTAHACRDLLRANPFSAVFVTVAA